MKTIGVAALLFVFPMLGGCKQTRDAMINKATDSPDVQLKLVTKMRESCISAADERVPNRPPAAETTIHNYCDCVAQKGSTAFSHAEFADLGVGGLGSMTPQQKAKMDNVVKTCQEQARIK